MQQTFLDTNPRPRRSRRYRRAQARLRADRAFQAQYGAMYWVRQGVVRKLSAQFPNVPDLDYELAADIGVGAMHRTWLTKKENLRLLDEDPAKFVNFARSQSYSRAARWLGRQLEQERRGRPVGERGRSPLTLNLHEMDKWSRQDRARLLRATGEGTVEDEALRFVADGDPVEVATTALAGVGEVSFQAFVHGRYGDDPWALVAERLGPRPTLHASGAIEWPACCGLI